MSGQNTTPLNTLEMGPATARPYSEYWAEFPEAMGLAKPSHIHKTRAMGRYVTDLTRYVIRDAAPYNITLMPDIQDDTLQEQSIGNGVAEWDRSIGTLNQYHDGQGDLLRAAGLLLHYNTVEPENFGFSDTESDEVYERFMGLMANNSLEHQKSTPDLLLAGQLIHKAGWVEKDKARQDELFKMAVSVYDFIHDDPGAVWVDRLTAGQFRSDIQFEWLSQELHEAVINEDKPRIEDLRLTAIELIKEMAADMQQASRLVREADEREEAVGGLVGFEWAGFMLEGYALIAVRDMLYVRSKPSIGTQYSVRRSFQHEDQPRTMKLWPKLSFDIVTQSRDPNGVIASTTPFQCKLRRKNGEVKNGDRPEDYRGIPCIGVTNLGTDKMIWSIDNLMVAYAKGELQRSTGPLAAVQRLFSAEVDTRLTAAPR